METTMKPVRIPNEITSKYLLTRFFALYLVGGAVALLISVLPLPDNAMLLAEGACVLSFFGLLCYPLYFDRVVFPEGVQIRLFGRVIRQIPISKFKILCAVGDDREQYLCLSSWDLDELAQRREKVLRRGLFYRQDLPFAK